MSKCLESKNRKRSASAKLLGVANKSTKRDGGKLGRIKDISKISTIFGQIKMKANLDERIANGEVIPGVTISYSEANAHKASSCTKSRASKYGIDKVTIKFPKAFSELPRKVKKQAKINFLATA